MQFLLQNKSSLWRSFQFVLNGSQYILRCKMQDATTIFHCVSKTITETLTRSRNDTQ